MQAQEVRSPLDRLVDGAVKIFQEVREGVALLREIRAAIAAQPTGLKLGFSDPAMTIVYCNATMCGGSWYRRENGENIAVGSRFSGRLLDFKIYERQNGEGGRLYARFEFEGKPGDRVAFEMGYDTIPYKCCVAAIANATPTQLQQAISLESYTREIKGAVGRKGFWIRWTAGSTPIEAAWNNADDWQQKYQLAAQNFAAAFGRSCTGFVENQAA